MMVKVMKERKSKNEKWPIWNSFKCICEKISLIKTICSQEEKA